MNVSIVSNFFICVTFLIHSQSIFLFISVFDTQAEAKSFIKSVIEGLTLEDGSILLAVMWVVESGRRYHSKFPRVLGLDVTFGTNAEKRPLFRVSGKTANNNNIPSVNAYIPSEQRWVFEWCLKDGLPSILDPKALKKTSIILTDQDEQLVGTLLFELRLGDNSIYGAARNRLCKWHKVRTLYYIFCLLPDFSHVHKLIVRSIVGTRRNPRNMY